MQHLKHCLNPKVVAGLAAVAVGVWVFAPGAFAAALPVLVLAVCPLSMVGMMVLMGGDKEGAKSGAGAGGHHEDAPEGSAAQMVDRDDRRVIQELRARVAELEARLLVESRRDGSGATASAGGNAGPVEADR